MNMWKTTGGAVAALGALALVVAWMPGIAGQETYTFKSGDGKPQHVVVSQGRALSLAQGGTRLGVTIRDVTPEDVTTLKLPGLSGVVIDDVEQDSAAAKGGVLKGDVAATFDGETVRSTAQFTRLVRETVPGRTVKMTVTRGGKRVDLSVAPQEADSGAVWMEREGPVLKKPKFNLMVPEGPMRQFRHFGGDDPDVFAFMAGRGRLGVTVQDLNPELAEFFGVKEGALVASVQKDTPAAKAGIKAGDVITAIDGKAVTGPGDVVEQLREKSGEVAVAVTRDKKALSLKAVIEKTEPQKPKVILRGVGA